MKSDSGVIKIRSTDLSKLTFHPQQIQGIEKHWEIISFSDSSSLLKINSYKWLLPSILNLLAGLGINDQFLLHVLLPLPFSGKGVSFLWLSYTIDMWKLLLLLIVLDGRKCKLKVHLVINYSSVLFFNDFCGKYFFLYARELSTSFLPTYFFSFLLSLPPSFVLPP